MLKVIGGIRYNTDTATPLADNEGGGPNRPNRTTTVYRGKAGGYFAYYWTCWQGEVSNIEPLSQDEAVELYESLPYQNVPFEEAFPGVEVRDA